MELSLTNDQRNEIDEHSESHKNKFNLYKVSLFFEGAFMIKSFFFLISWVAKLLGLCFLSSMKRNNEVVKWKLVYLKYQRMTHFFVMMSAVMDIYFYSTRIILHRSNDSSGIILKGFCCFLVTLVTIDVLEVVNISLQLQIPQVKMSEKKKNQLLSVLSQFSSSRPLKGKVKNAKLKRQGKISSKLQSEITQKKRILTRI